MDTGWIDEEWIEGQMLDIRMDAWQIYGWMAYVCVDRQINKTTKQ